MNSVQKNLMIADKLLANISKSKYEKNWEKAAIVASTYSDYLSIKCKEDAFVDESRNFEFYCNSPLRNHLVSNLNQFYDDIEDPKIILHHERSTDIDTILNVISELDYSEKIVMSATAHAVINCDVSLKLKADLLNIFFEEAYHLKIVELLTQFDLSKRDWIPQDKALNWSLVTKTNSAEDYMFIEHLLFEGRGGVASAFGCYQAKERGFENNDLELLKTICLQETNHGILGLKWYSNLNEKKGLSTNQKHILNIFVQNECVPPEKSEKYLRKNFSIYIIFLYLKNRPIENIEKIMKENVLQCLEDGTLLVSYKEMDESYKFINNIIKQ